jgi:membrane protease YdiL (CAAX protease family)
MNRSESYDPRWNTLGAPLAAEAISGRAASSGQYSLKKILTIWAAAVLPMAVLGWLVTPVVADHVNMGVGEANNLTFVRATMLTIGLIWQFVLAMGLIYNDEGNLRWSTIRRRCWLQTPRDPKSGQPRAKLFFWLIPLFFLLVFIQMAPLSEVVSSAFPFLAEPDKYSFATLMESDERKAALEGAWQLLGLFIVLGIFNTVIGEELLFRGVLLPKMQGVFGKGDWLANGLLFGLYHLHQPWGILGSALEGIFCLALPSKRFRSAWFGIILHSGQTMFFIFAALGLVLGMA